MATEVRSRRGSTVEHSAFVGADGELTVDTDKSTVVVHDGTTAGGAPLLREDLSNLPAGTIDNADIAASAEIAVSKLADGAANQVLTTDATGNSVGWSDNLDLPGTLDVSGQATFDGKVTINADLEVTGTTTTIDTATLVVEDKNIELGKVATPTDTTADGGGISLLGGTTKEIKWLDATDSWTSSEHVDLASGKVYKVNGVEVLSATALGSGVLITSANITDGTIVDGDISSTAEIAVGKLADGAARQLLQTDAAGSGVEWASDIDIPGTLDVTGAAVFDSSLAVTGALTKSGNNVVTVGDTGTVTSQMVADGTLVNADINASAAIDHSKLASITAGSVLLGNASNVPTATALTGDVTVNSGGVTAISSGVIVNADVSASAAISGSKIQAATTTNAGAVQLTDSVSSTSTTTAATPAAVKSAYDLANAALPKAGGTLTGDVVLSNQTYLRFGEATANGSNYVGFQGPASIAADVLWTLPSTDGTAGYALATDNAGALSWTPSFRTKSITLESPTASEKVILFFSTIALTVSQIRSVIIGGTNITFSIRYGTDVSQAGTEVVIGGIQTSNTTTGLSTTSFNSASIPADRFIWITTSAVTGTVGQLHVSLRF